jgi:hypothetical protein
MCRMNLLCVKLRVSSGITCVSSVAVTLLVVGQSDGMLLIKVSCHVACADRKTAFDDESVLVAK